MGGKALFFQAAAYAGHGDLDDEAKTVENTVEIAVQINGKTKGTVSIARDCDKDTAIAAGKEVIKDKLTGNIIKEIYVPGRIINIVMK